MLIVKPYANSSVRVISP